MTAHHLVSLPILRHRGMHSQLRNPTASESCAASGFPLPRTHDPPAGATPLAVEAASGFPLPLPPDPTPLLDKRPNTAHGVLSTAEAAQPLDGRSGPQYQQETSIHQRHDRTTITHATGKSRAQGKPALLRKERTTNSAKTGTRNQTRSNQMSACMFQQTFMTENVPIGGAHLSPLYVELEAISHALL